MVFIEKRLSDKNQKRLNWILVPPLLVYIFFIPEFRLINALDFLIYVAILLAYVVVVFLIRYRIADPIKVLEYDGRRINYAKAYSDQIDTVDLKRIQLIRYTASFLYFEGQYPYLKEVYVSRDNKHQLYQLVDIIGKDFPTILVEELK